MEEKTFTIELSDGSQIKNLKLNGNNYVSKKELTESDFEGKLKHIKIINETDNTFEELDNVELIQLIKYSDGYYFVLKEISEEELKRMKMQGDIEYLAMMTNADLEV